MPKNSFLIILFLAISSFLFGGIAAVPGYNYSINPLEGWNLQPYNDDSQLSWLSADNSIALTVSAWPGDTFNSLEELFNSESPNYNGSGNFVRFTYLGLESAIGEIEFSINQRTYKGWVIFMNGEENDFHLNAFSLVDSYSDSFNEIQSVLDSFSYGVKGNTLPGPVSAFLSQSPENINSNYTVDFFNQKFTIPASEYDLGNAQSIIEREADIMQNYAYDPENFYNAWKRYYQIIYRDNYIRLDALYNKISPLLPKDNYKKAEVLMFWIQTFTYTRDQETLSDLLNPYKAALTSSGDCDARSLLLGILLSKSGIKSLLLTSEKVKHAIIAADIEGDGLKYKYKGKNYLEIELTKQALIGEIDDKVKDPDLWTPVEMEYGNEF